MVMAINYDSSKDSNKYSPTLVKRWKIGEENNIMFNTKYRNPKNFGA